LQHEKEHFAKDTKDAKNKYALMPQLIHSRFGGDFNALLSSNLQVLVSLPSVSIPIPFLPGVPTIVFPLTGRASSSQSNPLHS
jgi:hypothetical protein